MKDQKEDIDEKMGIGFIELLKLIWNIRIRLIKGAVIGAIVGLIISLSLPKEYNVSVTLTPELSGPKSGGGLVSMAASFLGGTGLSQGGPDAVNPLMTPEILKSTPFLLEMLDARVVNPSKNIDTTLSAYLSTERGPWWGVVLGAPKLVIGGIKSLFSDKEEIRETARCTENVNSKIIHLSKKQAPKVEMLKSRIQALLDKQTRLITLYVNMQDPIIAAQVVDSVLTKLQKYLINYKISKANDDCLYWKKLYTENKQAYYKAQQKYADYVDAHNNVILQRDIVERDRLQNEMNFAYQSYLQVAQQYQMAQAKIQEAKPSFTVVEPAVVPEYPVGMGKMTRMIIYAFITILFLIFWELFLHDFLLDFKQAFLQVKSKEHI